MKKYLFLLFSIIFFSAIYSYGTTYYVNGQIGSDMNDGLSSIPSTANHGPKKTITAALNLVHPFDTVIIAAGLYLENLTIDSTMVLIGAGSEMDTLSNTIIKSPVINSGTGITLNTSGVDSVNRLVIKGIRIDGFQYGTTMASYTSFINVAAVNNADYGFYFPNGQAVDIEQLHCQASYNSKAGIYIGHAADIDGWLLDSCRLEGNNFSGLYTFCNNPSTGNVKNMIFRNSIIRKNFQKGMYFEKLQDALFENLTIDSCGYNPSYNFNTGMDINLKYNNYSNIVIKYCDFTNCGLGGSNEFGCGLIIKGRDDGSTYGANPATLDSVLVTNVDVSGSLHGIIVGEPNASNNTPTNLNVQLSDLSGVGFYGLVNNIKSDVKAHSNWWGVYAQPDTTVYLLNDTGDVNAITFFQHGWDLWSPGFDPSAFLTFDPNFHTLEEAFSLLINPWDHLAVPTFNYTGLTKINNAGILVLYHNVIIEDLLLDSMGWINISLDTGFTISSSITLKKWSGLFNWDAEIELLQNAIISEAPQNVIKGLVSTGRLLNLGGVTEDFGGLGIEITSSYTAPSPGYIYVRRYTDLIWPGNYTKVPREFNVMPQYNQGLDATLKYIYDDSEIDSISSENNLALFRSMDNGNTWILEGGSLDTVSNSITITGLDSLRGLWCAFDSTGISSISKLTENSNIQIFPNPSPDGNFTLLTNGPCSVSIYDATARLVFKEVLKYQGKIIKNLNLSEMPEGMYLVEIKDQSGGRVVRKLIIN